MAASLRSTRSVAKAVLPDRMGRMDYRLSEAILSGNANAGIPFVAISRFQSSAVYPRCSVQAAPPTGRDDFRLGQPRGEWPCAGDVLWYSLLLWLQRPSRKPRTAI